METAVMIAVTPAGVSDSSLTSLPSHLLLQLHTGQAPGKARRPGKRVRRGELPGAQRAQEEKGKNENGIFQHVPRTLSSEVLEGRPQMRGMSRKRTQGIGRAEGEHRKEPGSSHDDERRKPQAQFWSKTKLEN